MACCKCCCENGTPPGECCGSPEVCCKEPDICCGPIGSKECCEDPRVCCGVGASQACCLEGELCCNDSCCPPERCCGTGSGAVCCNEGQYCCDGVCSDEPCDCDGDGDCNDGCHCCCNKCQADPCGTDCEEFANWTVEARFCGHTLVWSSDGQGNTGDPESPHILFFGGNEYVPFRIFIRNAPALVLDEDCESENAYKCVGRISVEATGPSNGNYLFCVRETTATIVNGELKDIARNFPNDWLVPDICECASQDLQVTVNYNPLP